MSIFSSLSERSPIARNKRCDEAFCGTRFLKLRAHYSTLKCRFQGDFEYFSIVIFLSFSVIFLTKKRIPFWGIFEDKAAPERHSSGGGHYLNFIPIRIGILSLIVTQLGYDACKIASLVLYRTA